MQKYQNYKTTNIKWTDQIPVDWSEIPLRKVFEDVKNTNTNGDNIRMLSLVKDIGIIPYEDRGNQGNKSSEKLEKYKIVEKGDFVINKMNAVLGSLGISEYEGLVSPVYYVLRNRNEDEFISRYFELIFKTRSVQRFLRTMSKGIMEIRESVDWAELKNMALPLPSVEDQRSIVEYVNRVDKLTRDFIRQKQRYIELLKEYKQSKINELVTKGLDPNVKMKDSGIKWLGEIPANWRVSKLKKLVLLNSSKNESKDYKIALENLISWTGRIKNSEGIPFEGEGVSFLPGDVLFCKLRPYLAKVYLAKESGRCVNELLVLTPRERLTSEFLFARLLTYNFIQLVNSSTYGAKMPRASWDFIGEIEIAFPVDKEVQSAIYTETQRINNQTEQMIFKAEDQIKTIRKYRQSLIYELVTGIRKP